MDFKTDGIKSGSVIFSPKELEAVPFIHVFVQRPKAVNLSDIDRYAHSLYLGNLVVIVKVKTLLIFFAE